MYYASLVATIASQKVQCSRSNGRPCTCLLLYEARQFLKVIVTLSKNQSFDCVMGLSGQPIIINRSRKKVGQYSSPTAAAFDLAFLLP